MPTASWSWPGNITGEAAVLDWARINEMPVWYVLQPEKNYARWMNGKERKALRGELRSVYRVRGGLGRGD